MRGLFDRCLVLLDRSLDELRRVLHRSNGGWLGTGCTDLLRRLCGSRAKGLEISFGIAFCRRRFEHRYQEVLQVVRTMLPNWVLGMTTYSVAIPLLLFGLDRRARCGSMSAETL